MADKRDQYIMRFGIENGRMVVSEMNQIGEAGEKSMKKIGSVTDAVTASMGQLHGMITTRIMTVLGPTALLYAVGRAASSLADLGREARRVGTSAEDLQKYNYAAQQVTGSSAGMADAIGEFNKRLGEAFAGEGRLYEITKRYGIALEDRNGHQRASKDVLMDYADAVKNATDQTEKLFLVDKGFGNTNLVDVFASGKSGLEAFGIEAEKTGRVIEDRLINRAKEMDDLLNDMAHTWDVTWKTAAIDAIDKAIDLFEDLKNSIADVGMVSKAVFDALKEQGGINANTPAAIRAKGEAALAARADDAYQKWQATGFVPTSRLPPEAARPAPALPKTKEQLAAEDAAAKKLQGVIELLKFRNEQMKRGNEEQELYNQLRAAGVTLDSKAGQEIKLLVSEYKDLEDQQRRTKETTQALQKATDSFFNRLIDGFADGKISAAEFGQAALEIFKQIVTARDSVTGQSLAPGILSGIGNSLSGIFSSIFPFANGGIMTSGGPLPLRMYKNGGIANSPQVAIFAEEDKPEAYVPLPDGRSIPVTLTGGGGAMKIDVNIIDNAGVQVTAKPSRNGRGLDVMLDQRQTGNIRNGKTDKAMRDRYGIQRSLREI